MNGKKYHLVEPPVIDPQTQHSEHHGNGNPSIDIVPGR